MQDTKKIIGYTVKFQKKIGYALILIFIGFFVLNYFKNENSKYKMKVYNDSLEIIFPNEIQLKGYKIRSYEDNDIDVNGLSSYKILLSEEMNKNTDRILINKLSKYNIKQNHAYFYTMFQEDDKNPNKRLKSLGFCIKNDTVLIQSSNEKDFNFINECKQ